MPAHGEHSPVLAPHGEGEHDASVVDHRAEGPIVVDRRAHSPNIVDHEVHNPIAADHNAHSPNIVDHDAHSATVSDHDTHSLIAADHDAHSLIAADHNAHSQVDHDAHSTTVSDHDTHSLIAADHDAHSLIAADHDAHSLVASDHDAHSLITSDPGAHGQIVEDHTSVRSLVVVQDPHGEHPAGSSQALVPAEAVPSAATTALPPTAADPTPATTTQIPTAHDATPPDATLPPPPVAATPRTRSQEAAAHFKAVSYLAGAFGLLVSAIGWVLVRRVPLMQPTGQALASLLKNSAGALDDSVKGNRFKAMGQATSAVGQSVTLGAAVASSPPTRAAGAGLNAVGMTLTGVGELKDGNPWKAGTNFVAAALNLAGVVGNIMETTGALKVAFIAAEAVAAFNNSGTPAGGAIDDARKSKKSLPGLTDPKVVGQELAEFGLALSGIATVLNRVSMEDDDPQRWIALIHALGSVGMFLAMFGYAVSTWAEWPKKPAPADNAGLELGPTHGAPPPPGGGAPPPGNGAAATTAT